LGFSASSDSNVKTAASGILKFEEVLEMEQSSHYKNRKKTTVKPSGKHPDGIVKQEQCSSNCCCISGAIFQSIT
jgi:hypothetical protein